MTTIGASMACPHAPTCPLFPLMNASLGAWREHYCDSASGHAACARYERSQRGEVVPLGLLPNGHYDQHIQGQAADEPTMPGAVPPTGWFEQQRGPAAAAPSSGPPRPRSLTVKPRSVPAGSATNPLRRWWTRLSEWMQRNV